MNEEVVDEEVTDELPEDLDFHLEAKSCASPQLAITAGKSLSPITTHQYELKNYQHDHL